MAEDIIRSKNNPWSRKERRIFAAFEWNDRLKGRYQNLFEKITRNPFWEKESGYRWSVQYGAEFICPLDKNWGSKATQKDIEEFILQNKQLYDVFIKGISSCDLFIADITHHNPNVMLELGIAIQLNKNILVVTSQAIEDMVFDIRGLKATKYSSWRELKDLIEKQMKIYTEIKGQTFEGRHMKSKKYALSSYGTLKNKEAIPVSGLPRLKNLRIKVGFKFLYSTYNEFDWFGVSLRTKGPWRYNSELTLVRYSGKTRSLTWPEVRKENEGLDIKIVKEKWHTLELLIDENKLAAWVDDSFVIEDVGVIIEDFGEIWIASLDHHEMNNGVPNKDGNYVEVEFRDIEVLDLSTTVPLFNIQ